MPSSARVSTMLAARQNWVAWLRPLSVTRGWMPGHQQASLDGWDHGLGCFERVREPVHRID